MSREATELESQRQRAEALERQLALREAEAREAWGRYHALRDRRAVRAALRLADLRHLARGPRAAAHAAPEPSSEPLPVEPSPADPPLESPPPAEVAHVWPLGHFYSPVPDTRELATEAGRRRVWPSVPRETPGIDWREQSQLALLRELGGQRPFPFPPGPTGNPAEYHTGNPNFSQLDAWVLQAMLRHLRPERVIEVGCGWSSLVTARVNRDCLGGAVDVTCIEPYPPDFLGGGAIDGISRLVESPVQDVPPARFEELRAGDVLFIDTAHVVKTGGDVQHLYHEVVPRLRDGVVVHIHDIFLPWDYPPEWVLGGRAWNEQYLVQSFLAFNRAFDVMLAVAWLSHFHRDAVVEAVAGGEHALRDGGGSLWIRRGPA